MTKILKLGSFNTMKKLFGTLFLSVGIIFITEMTFAQTFVAMRVNIEGSVNGSHPTALSITSITATYSSAIQTLTVGPDVPGSSGFSYIESTGDLTFNLSNFNTALIFAPAAFATTFQFDVTIDDLSLATASQTVSTGQFIIPPATQSNQPAPVLMGTLSFDDNTSGGCGVCPPFLQFPPFPQFPVVGTPNFSSGGVEFVAPFGGIIGGMANSSGLSGAESMSVLSISVQVMNSSQGNPVDVGMIWEIGGCTNPPYSIILHNPQSVLIALASIGVIEVGISHSGVIYSESNGNLTVLDGSLDSTDSEGALVEFTLNSCSPVFLQDASDDPLAIELDKFEATKVTSNSVTLNWKTSSETNNEGFILKRKTPKTDFIEIASYKTDSELVGLGNSSLGRIYEFLDKTVKPNTSYIYRLSDADFDGNVFVHSKTIEVTTENEIILVPERYFLSQNHPNPFNPQTVISYELKTENSGRLEIFNVRGEKVKEFSLSESKGEVIWNGTNNFGKEISSGVYFYKLSTKDFSEVKKMTFLK